MKQLFLAFIFCCLCAGASHAATVSGIVTSVATCGPLAGQKVFLRDSFYNNIDSAVTNSAGLYSITFPTSWATGKAFLITVSTCSNVWNTPGHYTGGNSVVNAYVCGMPKSLYGTVMLGSAASTGPSKVYLITVKRNYPTPGDTTLTAVDSNILNGTGSFSFTRACAPNDTFLIKAMLLPGHASYSSYLPSYDSSLVWSSARRYYGYNFVSTSGSGYNIYLFPGTNPGGPGFIGGSVLVGANKGSAVGDPLAGRLMILVNSLTGVPTGYTYSDAAGKFSFSGIPYGTYKLFGDAWGLYNIPSTVTISATKPTINNLVFEENYVSNTFKAGTPAVVGSVRGPLANANVYPNPVTSYVSISGISDIRGSKTVVLRNLMGAVISNQTFADGRPVDIATGTLPAGTYTLQLITDAGGASFKIVK
jgi:hypothetical protein